MIATISWDVFGRMDQRLGEIVHTYHTWTYLILFAIIFVESFPLLTPLLPGGTLLLAAGAFAAKGWLNIGWLIPVLGLAAIAGDTLNYLLGYVLILVFPHHKPRKDSPDHHRLKRVHAYYDRYGALTLLLCRFVPIIRAVAPTLAGMGVMSYPRFLFFNALGCMFWTVFHLTLGYYCGRVPWVRTHLLQLVIGLLGLTFLSVGICWLWRRGRRAPQPPSAPHPNA
jgi:membrane-associated protein